MKNFKFNSICLVFAMLFLGSCQQDVLDTVARDAFAEDLIYADVDQLERLVFTAYNSTESWGVNKFQWWGRRFNIEVASFEAKFNFRDLDLLWMRAGQKAGNQRILNGKWANYWDYVRLTNEFLDRIDESPAMQNNPEAAGILKAEMKFLRANLYSKLLKWFGGVPIMERALGLNDDFNLPRDSYEDCVNFIVKELDEATAVLPMTRPDSEFGRATALAAMAVKSRTLLYAASKLHETSTVPSGAVYDYTNGNKWQDAADAAKAVIDAVSNRDLIATPTAKDYQELFLSPNQDIIFARPYNSEFFDFGTDVNSLWDKTQSPPGFDGWALSSPSHNYALQYNMVDGTTTDGGTYDSANPNDGREMRYYANLIFNGADFRGRQIEYYLSNDPNTPDGKDSPNTTLGNKLHSSKTGYNIRKFQDESVAVTGGISPNRPFILYRLAEIYLNYAEAQYELGNEDIARTYVNRSTARAGQPAITATGTALYEAIQRERRVELAFEGHNFFDERRWMNQDKLGFDIRGLKWTVNAAGILEHEEITVVTRPYFEKHYYMPIPNSEIEKAPAMIQNNGY